VHLFLTSACGGDEWLTSRPGRFTPGKNTGTHWIGGWMDPTASLDVLEKNLLQLPDFEPRRLSTIPTMLFQLL